MDTYKNSIHLKKNFGIRVLFKLMRTQIPGIKISADGRHFSSDIPFNELAPVVDNVLETHNIRLQGI